MMHNWRRYRGTLAALHALRQQRPDLQMLPSHCAHAHMMFTASLAQQAQRD
jgi:hypothetical protein